MFLPQRSLQTVTFLAILFFACFAMCQDLENRAVSEHQLLNDKGRAGQGLKRLMWLQHALGAAHTASSRESPAPNAGWDAQKRQDPSDFNNGEWSFNSDGDEASSLRKQLLEPMEAQGFLSLKQLGGKIPKGEILSKRSHSSRFMKPPVFPEIFLFTFDNKLTISKQSKVQFNCNVSLSEMNSVMCVKIYISISFV